MDLKLSDSLKLRLYEIIKENQYEKFTKFHKIIHFNPTEILNKLESKWTIIHFSCFYNNDKITEFILKLIYLYNKNEFTNIINLKTIEGWTPIMICAINNSMKSYNIIIKYGGIDFSMIDNQNQTTINLAAKYNAIEILNSLNNFKNIKIEPNFIKMQGILNLNDVYNSDNNMELNDLNNKLEIYLKDPKYKEILLKGKRIPCMICLSNLGYLFYTNCCGQPMHYICKGESIKKCPFCVKDNVLLQSDIIHPERALYL